MARPALLWFAFVVGRIHILEALIRTMSYEKAPVLAPGYGGISVAESVRSKLACAAYCDRTADCELFLFDAQTTDCMLVGVNSNTISSTVLASWTLFSVTPPPSSCPSDFMDDQIIGICYKVYTLDETWQTARVVCTQQGADLITLDTTLKLNYFKGILPYNDYHIGAQKSGGAFKWLTTGATVKTALWGHSMPDNPNAELCVALTTYTGMDLNDVYCNSYSFRFVCEYQ